jgi:hypothetical protein
MTMTIVELEKALRAKLEPQANTECGLERTIQASIAVSLKRIADAMEKPQVAASALVPDPNSASGFRVARMTA